MGNKSKCDGIKQVTKWRKGVGRDAEDKREAYGRHLSRQGTKKRVAGLSAGIDTSSKPMALGTSSTPSTSNEPG